VSGLTSDGKNLVSSTGAKYYCPTTHSN